MSLYEEMVSAHEDSEKAIWDIVNAKTPFALNSSHRAKKEAGDKFYASALQLAEENAKLRAAIQEAMDCGMVPSSSAREGGANRHVIQLQVADKLRDAMGM